MTLFTHSSNSPVTVNVSLDATLNTLWAMSMLHGDTEQLQSEPWLLETAAQLTPEQMETNHLVFTAFGEALFPAEPTADFPTYLAQLKQSAPIDLVTRLTHPVQELAEPLVARVEQLLADPPSIADAFAHPFDDAMGTMVCSAVAKKALLHEHRFPESTEQTLANPIGGGRHPCLSAASVAGSNR